MTTLRLLIFDSYDPWFNLAVEECIFRQMPATQRVLFLWRNADTVVIGCAQIFTDSLNPAPLEALAERLQGCQYRVEVLQQACDALRVDFPEQEKELPELSVWIAGAVR
ncbi:TPA: hypothetical protein N2F43_000517 [Salmonella enterica]|nr:hypothetical protein [Salmonella enterica]